MPAPKEELSSFPPVKTETQIIGISTPFGGWKSPLSSVASVPHFYASIEGTEEPLNATGKNATANQYAESDGITLFHPERFGHLSPGQAITVATDTGTKINDLPLNGSAISNGSNQAVCVLGNGRVIQFETDVPAVSQTLYYDPTAHTPATGSRNNDLIVFRDYGATPAEWVVWTYDISSSGGADIGIIKSSDMNNGASSAISNWWNNASYLNQALLKNGVPHKLSVGPDGNIYVTNGAQIVQILVPNNYALNDSSGAVKVQNVLQLGSGWIATDIIPFKNYSAIIASSNANGAQRGQVRVFFWDGLSSTVNGVTSIGANYIFDLPDNAGQGLFFDGSVLYAFTSGRNFSSKIFEYVGTKGFEQVFETPFISPGVTSLKGSIESFQKGLVMGAVKPFSGNPCAQSFRYYVGGFHDDMYLCDGTLAAGNLATAVGMVRNLYQSSLFYGVNYGGAYKIWVSDPTRYQASNNGSLTLDFRTILFTSGILGRRMYPLGFKMTFNRMKIMLSQWGTGASLLISAFNGYSQCLPGGSTDLLNRTIDTTTYPSGTAEIDITDFALTDLSSFYLNIRWTHASQTAVPAIIRQIVLYVDPSQ